MREFEDQNLPTTTNINQSIGNPLQDSVNKNISKNVLPGSIGETNRKKYTPLNQLSNFSRDIRILVRVIKKSTIKNFGAPSGDKNPGRLFNLNIIDKEKNEMQVTCFNRGVDKLYDVFQENSIYEIQGGYVKLNDPKYYSGANKSEYKLVIDEYTNIREMPDDGSIENNLTFNFVKISQIFNLNLYEKVDLCVYVLECGEALLKNTKNGELYIRKLLVCDVSECKVEFTLWRSHAQIGIQNGQYLVIKNAKVGEFNGRNFSSYDETSILINPQNIEQVEQLKVFIQNFGTEFRNVSTSEATAKKIPSENAFVDKVYFISEILQMAETEFQHVNYGNPTNSSFKKIKVIVTQMIHNDRNFYAGCTDAACKRKSVFNEQSEDWICNYCNKTFKKPAYYYNLSLRVKDCTCESWIDLFGINAEKILKINAEEYRNILLEDDKEKLKEISNNIEFKNYYFFVKPKIQAFNGKLKKKIYAYRFELVDYNTEIKRLANVLSRVLNFDEDNK